ncbi:MAG: hypothetical protein WC464_06355 [Bdellovibrionales bacterium]
MKEKIAYQASVLFSIVAFILLVVNISLANANRSLQNDLSKRQADIMQGQSLSQLNQALVRQIAEFSLKYDDAQLRNVLTEQGITLNGEAAANAKSKN